MSLLVHVNKIEVGNSSDLSSLKVLPGNQCTMQSGVEMKNLCLNELVGVQIEDSIENNQVLYTTTATFDTTDKSLLDGKQRCFRLTSVNGDVYIIGTKSRPFPVVKVNDNFPQKHPDSALKRVTITWKAPYSMLHLLVV